MRQSTYRERTAIRPLSSDIFVRTYRLFVPIVPPFRRNAMRFGRSASYSGRRGASSFPLRRMSVRFLTGAGSFEGKEKTIAENPGLPISFSHVPSNLPPEVTEAGEDDEVPPWGEERVDLSGDSDSSF